MRLLWTNPVALWGLALLAVPVLIHLLLRPRIQRLRIPSLRFLPTSRLASARRRMIHDWPLLLVRMAMVACAVAALAGPVLVTPARERLWADRVVRAVVVDAAVTADAGGAVVVERETDHARSGAEAAMRIETPRLADGVIEAAAWLGAAPPAAREIVVLSNFREGSVRARDLDAVAPGVGLRLVRVPLAAQTAPQVRVLTVDRGTPVEQSHTLDLDGGPAMSAAVTRDPVTLPLRVEATPDVQRLLDAAFEAVLAEGLLVEGDPVPLVLAWGADGERALRNVRLPSSPDVRLALDRFVAAVGPSRAPAGDVDPPPWVPVWPGRLAAAELGSSLVVFGRGDLGVDDALSVARAGLRSMYETPRLERFEPRGIAAEVLDGWERPAVPPDVSAVAKAGPSDARCAWGLVVLLMAIEQWMRRPRSVAVAPHTASEEEVRVA
jgi:hypothetical protein